MIHSLKKIIKRIVFACLRFFSLKKISGAVILMYHSVSDSKAFFAVTPEQFEKQMALLQKSGVNCVTYSELMRRYYTHENLANTVCVTFDDGYVDNRTEALPILKKYAIPATVFVSTGFMGTSRTTSQGDTIPVMDEAMIRELTDDGCIECLPHGHMHERLSRLGRVAAEQDIAQSKNMLERITGKSALYFAYPYGDYSSDTIEVLKSLGFNGAVTVKEGLMDATSQPFELPRMTMSRETSVSEFICKTTRPIAYMAVKRLFSI